MNPQIALVVWRLVVVRSFIIKNLVSIFDTKLLLVQNLIYMKRIMGALALLMIMAGCRSAASDKHVDKNKDRVPGKGIDGEHLSSVDYNIVFENKVVDGDSVQVLEIGQLEVPSGQIVVCDPLVVPDMLPLNKKVPPGRYPIIIYIAQTKESGDRYAIAKLEFNTKKADKWVLAVTDSQDVSLLKGKEEFFGFPVDAGLGGFFDYQAGLAYNRFIDDFMKKYPNGNIYDDLFAAEFKKNADDPNDPKDYGNWINFKIPNTNFNITMFQSGYGDGYYPAYWGMTKDNEIVSLVIDFLVLLSPEK